ncbi:phasin family protein [Sphingobium scionense]|uniref:Phasin domain-containing protein n=2 Tax=Sphingomonadaceae TaxID=41297 RepID=A0A1L4A071_9SPHN|nr:MULTISPECIES: phasin family protein [Sphingomonadaceae]API61273.1 hypothetical protein BSL82_17635 [Tardibacter chloracetimidivorans]MBB4151244.1 hypothetical protein [Sphingobium scionense]
MPANDSSSDSKATVPTSADAGFEQVQQLLDMANRSRQASLNALRTSSARTSKLAVEATTKTIAYSQTAATASAEHLSRLTQIRDFKEAAELQAEFVQSRLSAFRDYLRDLGKTVETTLTDLTSD